MCLRSYSNAKCSCFSYFETLKRSLSIFCFVEIINFNQVCPNLIGITYRIMGSVVLLCVGVLEDFIKELNVRLVAIDQPVMAEAINIC